jgi:hypothetical protein
MADAAGAEINATKPALWTEALRIEPGGFALGEGFRYALAVGAALAIGATFWRPDVGVVAAAGAFNAGVAGQISRAKHPAETMLPAGLALAGAVFFGTFLASRPTGRLLLLTGAALLGGWLAQRGPVWATATTQALAGLVIFGRFPLSAYDGALLAAEVLAGCGLQIALSLLGGWSFWRHRPSTSAWAPATEPWLHALRLAAVVAAADLLARRFEGQRGYWIVLTVIVVLKPAWEATVPRVAGRWLGTLVGVVPVSVVATLAHPRGFVLAVAVGLAAWAAYAVFQANYALYCVALSAFVVLLLDVVKTTPSAAAIDRALDTTLGAILALLVFLITRPLDRVRSDTP